MDLLSLICRGSRAADLHTICKGLLASASMHVPFLQAADLQANDWTTNERPRLLQEADRHGVDCFDWKFYHSANPSELAFLMDEPDPKSAAWHHFLGAGIREGRPFRYSC